MSLGSRLSQAAAIIGEQEKIKSVSNSASNSASNSMSKYNIHVDIKEREDLNMVEDFVRYIQRTSQESKRCSLLETNVYMQARLDILQWLFSECTVEFASEKCYHLGDGLTLHAKYAVQHACQPWVEVEVDWHPPGNGEHLPLFVLEDVMRDRKKTGRGKANGKGRSKCELIEDCEDNNIENCEGESLKKKKKKTIGGSKS